MMRILLISVFFLIVQCENQAIEVMGEEDGVLVLDQKNFKHALKTYPLLMVEFYAPWYARTLE